MHQIYTRNHKGGYMGSMFFGKSCIFYIQFMEEKKKHAQN